MRRTLLITGLILLASLFFTPIAVSEAPGAVAGVLRVAGAWTGEGTMIAPIRLVDGFIALLVVLVLAGWIAAWLDDRRHMRRQSAGKDDSKRAA